MGPSRPNPAARKVLRPQCGGAPSCAKTLIGIERVAFYHTWCGSFVVSMYHTFVSINQEMHLAFSSRDAISMLMHRCGAVAPFTDGMKKL